MMKEVVLIGILFGLLVGLVMVDAKAFFVIALLGFLIAVALYVEQEVRFNKDDHDHFNILDARVEADSKLLDGMTYGRTKCGTGEIRSL